MRVVVLLGGDSSEREVSLVTGTQVAEILKENGHDVIKIDPSATKNEQTELNGTDHHWLGIDYPEYDIQPLHRGTLYLKNILITKYLKPDIVFIALHGTKGEDGIVQSMLEAAEIPYTGSNSVSSMLAMQKDLSKIFFKLNNLPTPKAYILDRPDASRKKMKRLTFPQVVKPNDQGSTVGLSIVNNYDDLEKAIDTAFKYSSKVIIEEYIPGREITVGIVKSRTLPAIEIKPKHNFYDYECKYKTGMSEYEVPAKLDDELTQNLHNLAFKAHTALGCSGYSRVDFRVNEAGEPFILEINTLPGMTPTSLVPKAAKAAGINFNTLIEMIIEEALDKQGR
ncbi:MAG: D-alanine--D-alanine ligase [Calditrichaceae bacterium]|nr:D-alanine--D-alanine ligase [Calditrichaceae bacterium]